MVRRQRRTEALLAQQAERRPRRSPSVAFQHIVPLLGICRHVEGGEPDLILFTSQLPAEESLTLVQPSQRVLRAVVGGERQLVVLGDGVRVAMALWRLGHMD